MRYRHKATGVEIDLDLNGGLYRVLPTGLLIELIRKSNDWATLHKIKEDIISVPDQRKLSDYVYEMLKNKAPN